MKNKKLALGFMNTLILILVSLGIIIFYLNLENNSFSYINTEEKIIVDENLKMKDDKLPYEFLNLKVIENKGFDNLKEDITYHKVKKDYLYKGEISIYRINYVDGFNAVLTDTGKSGKSIGVNFEGVLLPNAKEFVPLGIDEKGNLYLVGEMTAEEPHNPNNK